ncbi:TRAF-interacting protein with FHA domain-containing protein A [Clarias gariepinus]|uniref:TRAF-interacting protein with FHA domain-containing protein A n=1 Tax=Clarias gariepinus TaxID=13013 RepID=UPI00234DBC1B|nr:TRAF-interacting protein with FHA domain-containing protein A [Clarias gariepinus]
MLAVSQTMVTEETLACLHLQLYHPEQSRHPLYSLLRMNQPYKISTEDPIRLGRDGQSCSFVLNDTRVSRKLLSIQAYRKRGSPDLRFSVQNMSLKGKILVNGCELSYLERVDLEEKALLRFGKYELFIWHEPGEAQDSFEVLFEKLNVSPSREMGIDMPCRIPVMDTGVRNYQNEALMSPEPLESDETVYM